MTHLLHSGWRDAVPPSSPTPSPSQSLLSDALKIAHAQPQDPLRRNKQVAQGSALDGHSHTHSVPLVPLPQAASGGSPNSPPVFPSSVLPSLAEVAARVVPVIDAALVTGGEESGSQDGRGGVCPSSTPHTVRSLSSGYQLARVKQRGHEHGPHAGAGQQHLASGESESGARFNVAPPLPDGFLQGRDRAHSAGGPARASSVQQTARPPQPQQQPKPNISNQNLSRFLHTDLGSSIFIHHLQSGSYFLKHSAVAAAAAGGTAASHPSIPSSIPAASSAPLPSSSPHWRHVWVSSDLRTVYWGEMTLSSNKRPSGCIPVDQIIVVFPGHQTRAFTHKQVGMTSTTAPSRHCDPSCCFSLVAPLRTLDLECISQADCEMWVLAFQFLLDHSRTHAVVPSKLSARAGVAAAPLPPLPASSPPSQDRHRMTPPLHPTSTSTEGAVPPNLSLVSALEVLSDLVHLGPTHASYSYFNPLPPNPPTPTCSSTSAFSSTHTSACPSPAQGDLRRLAPATRCSSGGSASSAASSVGSTPSFGSPAFSSHMQIGPQVGAVSFQQLTPNRSDSSATPPQPPLFHLEPSADHSSMTSPPQPAEAAPVAPQAHMSPLTLPMSQSQVFPGGLRRKSFANLEPLPEAEEDTAGSAHGPGTAGFVAVYDVQLVPATHEPEVAAAPPPPLQQPHPVQPLQQSLPPPHPSNPSAPLLQPQPNPSTSMSPLGGDINAPSHMRTSLHSLYMSMQQAPSAAVGVGATGVGALIAQPVAAPTSPPAMSSAALNRLESDVSRLERLLSRERHDHASLRVWVAHRFLHLQSHINSLSIERNKLQRRVQAEADEVEAEFEREVARVMGATPSQTSRRLAETRCHSSID